MQDLPNPLKILNSKISEMIINAPAVLDFATRKKRYRKVIKKIQQARILIAASTAIEDNTEIEKNLCLWQQKAEEELAPLVGIYRIVPEPLLAATQANDIQMLERLLQLYQDSPITDNQYDAFRYAIRHGNKAAVMLFLQYGYNIYCDQFANWMDNFICLFLSKTVSSKDKNEIAQAVLNTSVRAVQLAADNYKMDLNHIIVTYYWIDNENLREILLKFFIKLLDLPCVKTDLYSLLVFMLQQAKERQQDSEHGLAILKILIERGLKYQEGHLASHKIIYYCLRFNLVKILQVLLAYHWQMPKQLMLVSGISETDFGNDSNKTPLEVALEYRNIEMVRFLLERGVKSGDANSRWLIAIILGNSEQFNALLPVVKLNSFLFSSKYDPLSYAILSNKLDIIKYLIEQGFPVNILHMHVLADMYQESRINNAIISPISEIMTVLLLKIADKQQYYLAFLEAMLNSPQPCLLTVKQTLMQLKSLSDENKTVNEEPLLFTLMRSIIFRYSEPNAGSSIGLDDTDRNLIKAIITAGFNIKCQNNGGNRILHYLISFLPHDKAFAVIKYLLHEYSFDLNARNNDNESALFLALAKGELALAKLLTDKGADSKLLINNAGLTPLHKYLITKKQEQEEDRVYQKNIDYQIIKSIITVYGINPNHADKQGRRCIHITPYSKPKWLFLLGAHKDVSITAIVDEKQNNLLQDSKPKTRIAAYAENLILAYRNSNHTDNSVFSKIINLLAAGLKFQELLSIGNLELKEFLFKLMDFCPESLYIDTLINMINNNDSPDLIAAMLNYRKPLTARPEPVLINYKQSLLQANDIKLKYQMISNKILVLPNDIEALISLLDSSVIVNIVYTLNLRLIKYKNFKNENEVKFLCNFLSNLEYQDQLTLKDWQSIYEWNKQNNFNIYKLLMMLNLSDVLIYDGMLGLIDDNSFKFDFSHLADLLKSISIANNDIVKLRNILNRYKEDLRLMIAGPKLQQDHDRLSEMSFQLDAIEQSLLLLLEIEMQNHFKSKPLQYFTDITIFAAPAIAEMPCNSVLKKQRLEEDENLGTNPSKRRKLK